MVFHETRLKGAYLIELEPKVDDRGFFARTFCREEFEKRGLNACVVQCNVSFNRRKGTLRGMHYQVSPYAEAKLITCLAGIIYDVIIDLRHDSQTYRQWQAFQLWLGTGERRVVVPFAEKLADLVPPTAVRLRWDILWDAPAQS